MPCYDHNYTLNFIKDGKNMSICLLGNSRPSRARAKETTTPTSLYKFWIPGSFKADQRRDLTGSCRLGADAHETIPEEAALSYMWAHPPLLHRFPFLQIREPLPPPFRVAAWFLDFP